MIALCNAIPITNPFRDDIWAGLMAAYHIDIDLYEALLMEGCGTNADWQNLEGTIFECIDQQGGPFTGIARPIVEAMRDRVRTKCLETRGGQ